MSRGTVISGCERGRAWQQALKDGDLPMQRRFEFSSHGLFDCQVFSESSGIDGDTVIFNAALSACDRGSLWLKAFYHADHVKEYMCHCCTNTVLQSIRLSSCRGDVSFQALDILAEMHKALPLMSYCELEMQLFLDDRPLGSQCYHWPLAVTSCMQIRDAS